MIATVQLIARTVIVSGILALTLGHVMPTGRAIIPAVSIAALRHSALAVQHTNGNFLLTAFPVKHVEMIMIVVAPAITIAPILTVTFSSHLPNHFLDLNAAVAGAGLWSETINAPAQKMAAVAPSGIYRTHPLMVPLLGTCIW